MWELSSPFLNIHWFFDKLGMTGSRAQLYNGLVLIAMFFSCRLVWGTYQSALIYRDLWAGIHRGPDFLSAEKADVPARYAETMQFVTTEDTIPIWLAAVYVVSNLTLNSLNFYWFFKMIDAVRKRFDPKAEGKQGAAESVKVSADGTTAVTTGTDSGKITTRPRRRTILDGEDPDAPPPI